MLEKREKLVLEFPINGDAFETSEEFGQFCLRTITNYAYLIHKSNDKEEKQQLKKDCFNALLCAGHEAINSQIDFEGKKGKR